MVLWMYAFEWIKGYGLSFLRCIEVYEVLFSAFWYVLNNSLGYIAMRIDNTQTVTPPYV